METLPETINSGLCRKGNNTKSRKKELKQDTKGPLGEGPSGEWVGGGLDRSVRLIQSTNAYLVAFTGQTPL